jgi:predicted adenylyl cyclase CyaB
MAKIERERKYRLSEERVGELRHLLVAFGEWLSREAEADVFFDHPQIQLAENDQRLRVRYHGEDGSRELTFKGARRFDRGDKLRLEVTTALAGGQIDEILTHLGFSRVQQFVKLRETYRLGDALVRLDELDPVGWFCEIGALADGASLDSVAAALHLDASELEPRSYSELIDEAAESVPEALGNTG